MLWEPLNFVLHVAETRWRFRAGWWHTQGGVWGGLRRGLDVGADASSLGRRHKDPTGVLSREQRRCQCEASWLLSLPLGLGLSSSSLFIQDVQVLLIVFQGLLSALYIYLWWYPVNILLLGQKSLPFNKSWWKRIYIYFNPKDRY